ncbi:MAG TPA: hypothetical protein VFP58_04955, partial [Candidatus Eisenbacteria bacterium]|nr:hypothetical protein [Candidatus Eisenbacteria bacterium]
MRAAHPSPTAYLYPFLCVALACFVSPGMAQHGHEAEKAAERTIPKSIQEEHEEIHAALVEATKAPGQVGAAARELANVLHPHFVREEEIALPPLGLLEPLATGKTIPAETMKTVLAMTDLLRAELPK